MQPLLITGLVHFNDSIAAAARNGLACSAAPCEVVVPSEGRVLAFESDAAIDGITFSGGPLTVHCITADDDWYDGWYGSGAAPSVDIRDTSGDMHITGCWVAECARVSGTLRAEWTNDAICTDFSGTFVSLGDSMSSVTGTGALQSGGTGLTKLVGPAWTITGTGPVNFNLVEDFSFSGGTAGIEVWDWTWLRRPTVTIWEFASAAPMQEFVDQTIEVIGGWPEGSTLNGCIVSGTLGYVPRISASKVYVAEHAYGPIVSVIEDSEIFGDVRAEGRVFLNNVHGDISVASETSFVNTFSGTGNLLVDGPHTVMCPTCERVRLYDDSITTVETDLLIETEPTHAVNLNGHTALLGNSAPSRARREIVQNNTIVTMPHTEWLNGTVVFTPTTGFTEYHQEVSVYVRNANVSFNSSGIRMAGTITLRFDNCIVSAGTDGSPTIVETDPGLSPSVMIRDSTIKGYLVINSLNASASRGMHLGVHDSVTEKAGGLGLNGDNLDVTICNLTWSDDPSLTMPYIWIYSSAHQSYIDNAGDIFCGYDGTAESASDVSSDGSQCDPPIWTQNTGTRLGCAATTTTTITATTIPTTTTAMTTKTTTTAPPTTTERPPAASGSSSSKLNDAEIAGSVVGGVILVALIVVAGFAIAKRRNSTEYERIPSHVTSTAVGNTLTMQGAADSGAGPL